MTLDLAMIPEHDTKSTDNKSKIRHIIWDIKIKEKELVNRVKSQWMEWKKDFQSKYYI